jgi:electron transfer flavoprotein beta subunit
MKIVVAIKQVPERDAQLSVAADGRWIDESDLAYTINEPDAYALEEALQLKEALQQSGQPGCEVIALCCGPQRVASTLRDALAKGADRAIHILTGSGADDLAQRDTLSLARLLADAIRPEAPDLILTGLQSDDLGLGQTGVILAELLQIPHATIIMQVEMMRDEITPPASPHRIKARRELEDGWFQHIEMPLPALLTIQSGGNKLRYATLMGIKRAKSKPTATLPAAPTTTPPAVELIRVYLPEKQRRTQMLTGTPAEIAAQLVDKLRSEVRVL